MTKQIKGCPPIVELTQTQKDIRDKSMEFVRKFDHLIADPDRLVNSQFKRIYGRDMQDITSFTDAELFTDYHRFESKIQELGKQIETGKMSGKIGRWLWTTQELAERNPIMANVYDDFVRTRLNYKGRQLKSDSQFNSILNHLKRASIIDPMYQNLSSTNRSIKSPLGKKKLDEAVEYASRLESDIEQLRIDAENKVPGAQEKFRVKVNEMNEWLISGEGKIFGDFVMYIEKGLPQISKEISKYMKRKFELQEKNKGKVWTGPSREKLKDQIRKHVGSIKLITNETINGVQRKVETPIQGEMQAALVEYVDYMSGLYHVLEKGADAYIDSAILAISNKFSPGQRKIRINKLKEMKKNLKKAMMPDEKIGYYPHFRLDMTAKFLDGLLPNADRLQVQTMEGLSWSKKGIDTAIEDLSTFLSGRLKGRTEDVDPESYSRNFPAVIRRYASEVNRFNHVAHVQKYTREALTEAKRIYGKGKELDGLGQYFVEMVEDMNQAELGVKGIKHPEWENARRVLLGLEYMSKLGFNFRTATKNATQGLLNWVFLGPRTIRQSKEFYEDKGAGFENEVNTMMEEAGLVFRTTTPELQEAMGVLPQRQLVRLSEGFSIEFKKPTAVDKFTKQMISYAGKGEKLWHPSFLMQRVENYNRRRTFKIAYSKMYQQLEGNTGFRKWAGGKGNLDQQIKTRARNYAIRMTNMLHFDYGDISKSKLLRHPLGRFVFQFQHYAQKFFELNKKALYDDLKIAYKKGDMFGEEVSTASRMGFVYAAAPAILSWLTGTNVYNVVEHATYNKFEDLFYYLTGDEEEIRKASFGRGALGVVGFPLLSDLITVGELTNIVDYSDDDWFTLLTGYQSYRKEDKELRLMKTIGLINTQLGRTVGQTWPLISDGHLGTAIQFEMGFYPDKKVKEVSEYFYKIARNTAPDLAEYYEDVISEYKKFVKKSKSQQQHYYRGH